jgi:Putative peptidoglycan binding domain
MPRRRRRGAAAVAVEAEAERGLLTRILLHSPKDMVAGALAFTAVSAIIANALFLQSGPHPAPMFGSVVTLPAAALAPASPLPRPRPVEVAIRPVETMPAESKLAEPKSAEPKSAEPKASDPMANLVRATAVSPVATPNVPRPPASIPVSPHEATALTPAARRVAAVQRTLTEYGYAQLKPTGIMGADTLAAVQKFERERKIPVTGQISDRLVHELAAVTGRPVE